MNTCILMAQIVSPPELRKTPEKDISISQMLVQFSGLGPNDPPATMRVIGWGDMGEKIYSTYSEGDRVIIQGRLSMNTIDRPEGFKEKKAELVVSHIYSLGSSDLSIPSSPTVSTSPPPDNVVPLKPTPKPQYDDTAKDDTFTSESITETPPTVPVVNTAGNPKDNDLDDIPF